MPLIKRILALPGQTVCRNELAISVDGIEMGHGTRRATGVAGHFRSGRDAESSHKGEVFLMNWDEPASLDGRYFGPIASSSIIGRATPAVDIRGGLSMRAPQTARLSCRLDRRNIPSFPPAPGYADAGDRRHPLSLGNPAAGGPQPDLCLQSRHKRPSLISLTLKSVQISE